MRVYNIIKQFTHFFYIPFLDNISHNDKDRDAADALLALKDKPKPH
jgi:hypothetical protein